jgi:Cytochrome C oxidase, cbb3-type, subunit III
MRRTLDPERLRSMTRGLHPSITCVLLILGGGGCGGEQRSGAAPMADTSRVSTGDTASATTGDTAGVARIDTGGRATADSARLATDTARAVAATPPPRKPRAPRRAAPATPPPDTGTADTSTAANPAQPSTPATDTAITAAASPDTTSTSSDTTSTPPSQTTAAAPLRDEYHRAPLDTVSQEVYDGWKQYNLNCARCHGEDVLGTTIAPHLLVSLKPEGPINTKELFVEVVCAGRPAKGMPSWCALGMDKPKIESIYAYVKGRSDAKLRPGRPALRGG